MQVTGTPELDTAAEPSGPQGMPMAGRVSSTFGPVDVGVVDFGGFVAAVCGAALDVAVGRLVALDVGGAEVVTGGGGATTDGAGGGAITTGGALSTGAGVNDSEVVFSTLAGESFCCDAERNALMPANHAISTTAIAPPMAAE